MKIASIVLCAGKSTRIKSTKSKMLHSVCGKPLCAWPIENALNIGSHPTVIVVGHQADQIKADLSERFSDQVIFALQAEQKGTGHAVKIALEQLRSFDGTILVLCGDTPLLVGGTLRKICEEREKRGVNLAMLTTSLQNPMGYGRILRDNAGNIAGIVEENDADAKQKQITEINPAIYAFKSDFLKNALEKITADNAKGEYYLTDVVQQAAQSGTIISVTISAHEALGINDRLQLAEAEQALRRRVVDEWMRNGVTCIDPDRTYIDADVQLGQDVVLEPGVRLIGKCQIGNYVSVGTGAILDDTVVDDHARIYPYSICEKAQIGKGAEIGPFARLRPETVLDESTKIGNFVEVKKSHFKKGAKANHLAYIGDADVGERCNIGAGTITCNYDGFHKHRTTLGDGVFIGSNSTLVAPVTVGDEAYVAAGSTITKNVATDALAIGRARQENKEAYAPRIRRKLKTRE